MQQKRKLPVSKRGVLKIRLDYSNYISAVVADIADIPERGRQKVYSGPPGVQGRLTGRQLGERKQLPIPPFS